MHRTYIGASAGGAVSGASAGGAVSGASAGGAVSGASAGGAVSGASEQEPESRSEILLNAAVPPRHSGVIALVSGRSVEAEARPEGDLVRVRANGGEVVLTVLVTDAGPVLRFESAALELSAARDVSIECERFDVRARGEASVTTGGDLVERVGGKAVREVAGASSHEAHEVSIAARRGSVDVRANDDVNVKGDRIRLNCEPSPVPATWDEFLARIQSDSTGS
jgi:hypothetical protein